MIGRGALQDPLLFHRIRSHCHQGIPAQQTSQFKEAAGCPSPAVDEAAVVADFVQRYAACGFRGHAGGASDLVRRADQPNLVLLHVFD